MIFTYKLARRLARLRLAFTISVLAACQAEGPSAVTQPETPGPNPTGVQIIPSHLVLAPDSTAHFTATVRNAAGETLALPVQWGATGGDIDSSGMFQADSAPGEFRVIGRVVGYPLADTALVQVQAPSTLPPSPSESPGYPDTIFAESFESGDFEVWDDGVNRELHHIITDPAAGVDGARFLRITYPEGKDGGWLTRFFMPGYDSLYVSFLVRFPPDWRGATKLIRARGSRIDDRWSSMGQAGLCPTGSDFFATGLVTAAGDPGDVRFYTYYPEMHREDDGVTCYGRYGPNDDWQSVYTGASALSRGAWHRVAFWVKLNTPGSFDGEQSFWVDGALRGSWSGLELRKSDVLRLNSVMISASMPPGAPVTESLDFDDVVVLTGRPR